MRLPSFEIVNQRSIKLAQCVKVPPLMVVAGPNGSGKSTLLNAIRSQAGYTNIMYVGPHRAMRRQQVQSRHLLAPSISFETLLSGQDVPGFEGIQIFGGSRDPWGYDDSANYLKHALCQIEEVNGRSKWGQTPFKSVWNKRGRVRYIRGLPKMRSNPLILVPIRMGAGLQLRVAPTCSWLDTP